MRMESQASQLVFPDTNGGWGHSFSCGVQQILCSNFVYYQAASFLVAPSAGLQKGFTVDLFAFVFVCSHSHFWMLASQSPIQNTLGKKKTQEFSTMFFLGFKDSQLVCLLSFTFQSFMFVLYLISRSLAVLCRIKRERYICSFLCWSLFY